MGARALAGLSCAAACAAACMVNPEFDAPVAGTTSSSGGDTIAGSSDDDDSSAGVDSGDPDVCGDGIVTGDEACDDGNDIDGDGCNLECTLGGELLWEIRHDGGEAGSDATHDLALLADDSVVLAGVTRVAGLQAELVRVDREGTELWSHVHAVAAATASDGWGAARLDDGAVLVGSGNDGTMFVRAVDADGVERWTLETPGRAYDASATADSGIWVAGRLADETAALWHVDAEGVLVATYDEASGTMPTGSVVWGVAIGANGRIASTGEVIADARAFGREVWNDSGEVTWEIDVTALGADEDAGYGVTVAPGGALAMVGDVVRGSQRNGWLLRRDTGGRMLPAIEQIEQGNYHGVAIGPSGEIAVSGWVDNGLGKIALVVKYAVDGAIAWRHEITGDVVVGENKAWTVVVRSDGVVVAAGELVDSMTGLDRWVVAYAP